MRQRKKYTFWTKAREVQQQFLDTSVCFFQDTLWIPDHLWTPKTVEKSSVGSKLLFRLSFSNPNQAPLFLVMPKIPPLLNSFLSFWPESACLARNGDTALYSGLLTRRRNENKRLRKAMNHRCHHQRGGWCGSLLRSHKTLGVMEEMLKSLPLHKQMCFDSSAVMDRFKWNYLRTSKAADK